MYNLKEAEFSLICSESHLPKCSHFGSCGGCQYQHIPYEEQLAQKMIFVTRCFQKETRPILPCEPVWNYRNKMEFTFSQAKSGERFLGLSKKREGREFTRVSFRERVVY